jgi:tetratricopeptide (TPR) repeat protein
MRGEFHKAKTRIERALKIPKRVFSEGHMNTATALQNLGSTYEMFAEYGKAKELVEQALKITEQTFGNDNINATELLKDLGNHCYRNGTPEMLKKAYEYCHR